MTVEAGSILVTTEVVVSVEAGKVIVEPDSVIVEAGITVVLVKLAVTVEAAKVMVVGTANSILTVTNWVTD